MVDHCVLDTNNTEAQSVDTMSIGELKRELMDLGDPSFVFTDHDELIAALIAARRKEQFTSLSKNTFRSLPLVDKSVTKSKTLIAPAIIPTIDEESDVMQTRFGSSVQRSRLLRRASIKGGVSIPFKTRKSIDVSYNMLEHTDESIRLVEYFIVVSSKPRMKDINQTKNEAKNPLDPTRDDLDARTLMRIKTRSPHWHDAPATFSNNSAVCIVSTTNRSTASTSSTCSSDDIDYSGHGSIQSEIWPAKPNHSMTTSSQPVPHVSFMRECLLEPVITARYPLTDRPDHPLNPNLPQFCHPAGTSIVHPSTEYKMPRIHHFVLTDINAGKLYGTCLTVYEEYTPEKSKQSNNESPTIGMSKVTYYVPRVLCLLSTWPYLTAFRTYLTQLYRLATSTDLMEAPIERYVLNICEEVPAPPPGAFEVQISILKTPIRFWAPPAQQPIAYVSLPFEALFECLEINNVLYVWYTLACERKVLLVSDQLSLLTVCCEILTSLLFPMRWSHLYIPLLPRSLSQMLDAPMPYLCGMSRENFHHAIGDVGDETVVVDLDKNVITLGSNALELPPLPHKQRLRLETELKKNIGHVFWNARGMTLEDAALVATSNDGDRHVKDILNNAHSLWNEKIQSVDEAFNLAHAPDSTSMLYNDDARADSSDALSKQSRWDAVQEAFLRFYVAALKDYRKFLPLDTSTGQQNNWRGRDGKESLRFQAEEFILSQRHDFQPFLEELLCTQQFDDFITKRIYNASNEPDVTFFDKSIDAKKNRSVLKIKKTDTSFLHSANAHRALQLYGAITPNRDGISSSASEKVDSNGYSVYQYPTWPETFDESLFCEPRPVPKNITVEFERRIALRFKLKAIAKERRAERLKALHK